MLRNFSIAPLDVYVDSPWYLHNRALSLHAHSFLIFKAIDAIIDCIDNLPSKILWYCYLNTYTFMIVIPWIAFIMDFNWYGVNLFCYVLLVLCLCWMRFLFYFLSMYVCLWIGVLRKRILPSQQKLKWEKRSQKELHAYA